MQPVHATSTRRRITVTDDRSGAWARTEVGARARAHAAARNACADVNGPGITVPSWPEPTAAGHPGDSPGRKGIASARCECTSDEGAGARSASADHTGPELKEMTAGYG